MGVADGSRVGTGGRRGSLSLGAGRDGSGEVGREGAVVGTVAGLLAGGGARGTVGEAGASDADMVSGSATTAATAHDSPTPIAVRTVLRRDAPRRIASYRPGGGLR